MAALKRVLRRARTLFWTSLSILIIFTATLVGLGKLMMPYSHHYQPRLEAWLSQEFGQKVTLEGFAGEWNAFGPRLSLRGLRIQPADGGTGEVAIAHAALDLKPLNFLLSGKAMYNFLVIGADIRLVHNLEGQYLLSGLGVGGANAGGESGLRNLIGIGELILDNSSLDYIDEKHDVHLRLTAIDARLQLDGELLAMTLEAGLTDETSGRVYGEIDASGLLTLAEDNGLKEAHWQISVRELLLASFQGRLPSNPFLPREGRINAELWCDWDNENQLQVQGVVDLKNGLLVMDEQETVVEHLNSRFDWKFAGKKDWRMDLNELEYDDGVHAWSSPSIALARKVTEDLGLWISAHQIPLGAPLKLARNIMSIYGTKWPQFLPGSADGTVNDLELVLDAKWHIKMARGKASQASVADWGKWPDLQGIEADVDLGQGYGNLALRSGRLDVQWPRMFRQPLDFTLPECNVDITWGGGWQVAFQACSLANEALAVAGDVLMVKNTGRPAIDLNVKLVRGQLGSLAPYWPQAIMGKNILRWLRRGLISGEIRDGRFQIRGDMDDWPFRNHRGTYESLAEINDAELDYVAGWPRAKDIEAKVRFAGPSMNAEGSIGQIGGVQAQQVSAQIADLKSPLLKVRYDTESNLDTLVNFLVQSPLQEQIGTDLGRFEFSGPVVTGGLLTVPLGTRKGNLVVDGRVELLQNRFFDPGSDVALDAISGELHYSENGVQGSDLHVEYKGKPATMELFADKNAAEKFRVNVSGVFEAQDIMPDFLREGYVEFERLQGEAEWLVSVVVPDSEPDQASITELIIKSDLVGLQIDLPDPLHKLAAQRWPLDLRYPLSGRTGLLDLDLNNRIKLLIEISRSTTHDGEEPLIDRALISLGERSLEMPPSGMIRLDGSTDSLDLDGWIDIVIAGAQKDRGLAGLQLDQSNLNAGSMLFLDRYFSEVGIGLSISEEDVRAVFTAENINGHIVFNPDSGSGGSLSAEFERLALDQPVSSGVDMESNPGELPALHLYAKSFRYVGIEMGETRVEAYPDANSFHFEKVESKSEQLSIRAKGDWSQVDGRHRSDFKIMVTAESLGELMQSMGISSTLEGGQTVLNFNAWWPGSPAAFALTRLNGELDFNVTRGQITNATAGPGRILGLLSIQALPRRLALDFGDVFDSGFTFDEAQGTFQLENGTATTNDVKLTSSAAKISLSGSTDLVEQQYDQLMTINPGLGNTLPVIGALAGGPGGAAAGLALQGLLQKQLGEASQVQYTITGSWNEPLIEPVLKEQEGG